MANIKSAKDRILTNRRDMLKNQRFTTEIKTLLKEVRSSAVSKKSNVQELLSKTFSRIDSAVSKGIIKKQNAARKKARLSRAVFKATKVSV